MTFESEDLEFFLETYGRPTQYIPAHPETLKRLADHLPAMFIDYWKELGFSVFQNGYFQLVNPEVYAPALQSWLRETDYPGDDTYHAIVKDFYGNLYTWGERTGQDFSIDIIQNAIIKTQRNDEKRLQGDKAYIAEETMFQAVDIEPGDVSWETFEEALATLGPLGDNEAYGFSLLLPLGGAFDVSNMKIVSAPEYLDRVAKMGAPDAIDFRELMRRAFSR